MEFASNKQSFADSYVMSVSGIHGIHVNAICFNGFTWSLKLNDWI